MALYRLVSWWQMNVNNISALANVLMVLVLFFTALFAFKAWYATERTRKDHNFTVVLKHLQQEDMRLARRILIGEIGRLGEDYRNWKAQDWKRNAAEKVCAGYDNIGIMLNTGLFDEDLIIEWADSIIKSWNAALPMIRDYTQKRGELYYNNFREIYYTVLELIFIRELYKLIKAKKSLTLDEVIKYFSINPPRYLEGYKLNDEIIKLILGRMERNGRISQFPISEGNKQITLKWRGQRKAQKLSPPICEYCNFYELKDEKGFCSILQGYVKTDECQLWVDP